MLGIEGRIPDGWTLKATRASVGHARYETPDGFIDLDYFDLLPGITLTRIDLHCAVLPAFNPLGDQLATVNWCAAGRCEVDFGPRGSMVVGEQMLCLSSSVARSFSYPTGCYQGFEYLIDFNRIASSAQAVFDSFDLTKGVLRRVFHPHERGVNLAPSGELLDAVRVVEVELSGDEPRLPWLRLETCRLLMLLAQTDLEEARVAGSYLQRSQRDMAQAVYQQLVEEPPHPIDLPGMAARFRVSESSLRAYFTRVYGKSPAAFGRDRTLGEAARLLEETDRSVADIAQLCGYLNPSKFAAAFRRAQGMSPLEYRRRHRLSQPTTAERAEGEA